MAKAKQTKMKVMVSSSVRHKEPMLDQIHGLLDGLGYNVWMSYRGTVRNIPGKSAFDSCLAAVEHCDIFFGIRVRWRGPMPKCWPPSARRSRSRRCSCRVRIAGSISQPMTY